MSPRHATRWDQTVFSHFSQLHFQTKLLETLVSHLSSDLPSSDSVLVTTLCLEMLLSGSVESHRTCQCVQAGCVFRGGLSAMLRAHLLPTAYFPLLLPHPTGSPVFYSIRDPGFVNASMRLSQWPLPCTVLPGSSSLAVLATIRACSQVCQL